MNENKFTVQVDINHLSLFQSNQTYEMIYSRLPNETRKDVSVSIIDPIGGRHFCDRNEGIAPDQSYICQNCFNVDCRMCKRYSNGENGNNT